MKKHVPASDFVEQYTLCCIIEKSRVTPGHKASFPEIQSEYVVLEVSNPALKHYELESKDYAEDQSKAYRQGWPTGKSSNKSKGYPTNKPTGQSSERSKE